MAKVFGPLLLTWETQRKLLALAGPSPGCCQHLVSEQVNGIYVSLSPFNNSAAMLQHVALIISLKKENDEQRVVTGIPFCLSEL